ncbi:sulfite oxidase subunit YedZ [Erythrobacter arachoides]|uniref:Sulfite oxidase subunit YedZ n=1 Tax=Aurantiacibacter arachoides TaxID=1850444 RepID=A0A844ZZT2_9SPHN|nr:ferric reductase-like transmembrane domain-containing protein [Aurantiacibacter arachoides]MXO93228.1 sulfite oxidase subunit YedZ [Aurantiacibacter arachoides]GGD50981.1 protein-methionine-sulfoxide reductase heme-binding subunit MsrQ [Aurantiacibacter arachoides]
MDSARSTRPLLWLVLALPGLWMAWRWLATPEAYGYGHAIGDTGDWSAWLLLVTLAVTPIRLAFRRNAITQFLVRRRRDLGVASFVYALGHLLLYLWQKQAFARVFSEAGELQYLTGWLAFALFVPLAVTSNDGAMRRLKRNWKRLHRLVYPAAVLTFVHWALTAFDPMTAYIHIGMLAAIWIARIALRRRART